MRLLMVLAAMGVLLGAGPARAQAVDPLPTPATHVAILDYETNRILYCKNCDVPMPPASMSKLMTILVVADKIKAGSITMDTTFPVSENAWRHGAQSDGSHMFLELNSRVSVRDLISGVVIVSANDGCIVLAEGIAGSEEGFVDLMNKKGRELGLKTASFRNVTGLPDPDHVISAGDLARLSRYIIATHPELYKLYSQPTFTFNNKTQENRNPLIGRFAGADGIKTGHTSASGYGMVGSAVVNGKRRIIVFNGLPTMAARATEAERLMRAAFYDFDAMKVFKKGAKVGDASVWLGSKPTVGLVATQDVDVGFHRSAKSALKASIVYDGPLAAPIKKGAIVGKLVVEGPGVPKQEIPLAAATKVGRKGFVGRAMFGAHQLLGGE